MPRFGARSSASDRRPALVSCGRDEQTKQRWRSLALGLLLLLAAGLALALLATVALAVIPLVAPPGPPVDPVPPPDFYGPCPILLPGCG